MTSKTCPECGQVMAGSRCPACAELDDPKLRR
jgi:transposase